MANDSSDPLIRFLLGLIIADEERHHELTGRMISKLKDELSSSRPANPRRRDEKADPLLRSVVLFVAAERSAIQEYEKLKKESKGLARDVFTLLYTTMSFVRLDRYQRERGYERIRRVELSTATPRERLQEPTGQVEKCLTSNEAMREATRCLDCGVTPVFDGNRCILCGGCADVCPTLCLKIIPLSALKPTPDIAELLGSELGDDPNLEENSAILKDEDRCIRCALCVERCPADAIAMPELGLTEQQIDQLTFYMLSLRGRNFQEALWPKDRIRAERFGVREFSTDGATLYGTYCAACHEGLSSREVCCRFE